MTLVLDAALRSSVPVALVLLACVLLRKRSAALRHAVLATGLLAAIAVVPLSWIVPSWTVAPPGATQRTTPGAPLIAALPGLARVFPVPQTEAGALGEPRATAARPRGGGVSSASVLFAIWLAGVALGGAMLLLGLLGLVRLTRRAEPVVDGTWHRLALELAGRSGIHRRVRLLEAHASDVLATWGVFRPCVLLPAQATGWDEERVRIALSHEMAHVRRCDWLVQMAAALLRTLFWFNPLLWLLGARLRRESEHACDDAVLGSGVPAGRYASQLVDIARACRRPCAPRVPAMPVARPSTLEGRITAMLDTRLNRQAPSRGALVLIAAALAAVAIPIASFELSAQGLAPGALTGYVYDNTGGVLPGVEVVLLDPQDRERRSAVSDGTGRFQFQTVESGKYALQARLAGFRTFLRELELKQPRDWTRNITLQVGALEETISVTGKRPAEIVPLRQGASPSRPVRVGGSIKVPHKVKSVNPIYPAAMQEAGIEGLVRMEAVIGADGRVVSARVLSAEVHPALGRAAEEAVRQWEFTPTLLNNIAVDVEMTVSIDFSLED